MSLAEYLEAASRTGFGWREHDCCQFLRGWIIQRGWADPAAGVEYADEAEALALVERAGGLEPLLRELASRAGLVETRAPRVGDVGLVTVTTASGRFPAGGILAGRRWAMLTRRGLQMAPGAPLVAWRV